MRFMRSMRGDLFPVVEGHCKKYAMARHVRQATTASRRETACTKRKVPRVDGSVETYAIRTAPTLSLTPRLLLIFRHRDRDRDRDYCPQTSRPTRRG
jgi:hypothetical protein